MIQSKNTQPARIPGRMLGVKLQEKITLLNSVHHTYLSSISVHQTRNQDSMSTRMGIFIRIYVLRLERAEQFLLLIFVLFYQNSHFHTDIYTGKRLKFVEVYGELLCEKRRMDYCITRREDVTYYI